MRSNLKFLSSIAFAVTFIVGGFFISNTASAEATLTLTAPATTTITQSILLAETNGKANDNSAVDAAVVGLIPIKVRLQNTGDIASVNALITPINAGSHIQLWAKDTSNNWYDINVAGWIAPPGVAFPTLYDATTNVYAISDIANAYPLTVNLVNASAPNTILATASGTVNVNAPAPVTVASVASLSDLKAALANPLIATINITTSFETSEKIVVDHSVTINGGNNTITFTGDIKGTNEVPIWNSNYILQVYKTTATIDSLKLTGGDAALLVNGSDVTLTGIIDVSGNEFGGIEVSKGRDTGTSKLTVTGATFTNTTEAYSLPTIWTVNGQGTVTDGTFTTNTTVKLDQTQYYKDAGHAFKTASVSSQSELKTALADVNVATINITAPISTTEKILVSRPVTINGGGNAITFSGVTTWISGNSNYVLHVYRTTGVTINNLKITGGYAGLLVNGSEVTLGDVDVSNNAVGGIEVSKGTGVTETPKLTITGTLKNDSEGYALPTIWEDQITGTVTGGSFTTTSTISAGQVQYYIFAENKAKTVSVTDQATLKTALADVNVSTITIGQDFTVTEKINITRPVTIDGANKTISMTGNNPLVWNSASAYIFQVYGTTGVTIKNINLTGGNAALLINHSTATLSGTIDVSGNGFGGIESSNGSLLTISGTLTDSTESYGKPIAWEDGLTGNTVTGKLFTQSLTAKVGQIQYYLNADKAFKTSDVSTQGELETALADSEVGVINITANIDTATKFVLGHPVIINGNTHSITFTGVNKDWISNASNYVLQVYRTSSTINDLKLTGGYAGLLVNGSTVTINNVDVSGNNVGGIEVSKGSGVTEIPSLIITGTFKNDSEAYAHPTVWEDSINGYSVTDKSFTQSLTVRAGQIQYYLVKSNSTKTATVSNLDQLNAALADSEVGIINLIANIETSVKLLLAHPSTINGNNYLITLTGDTTGWQGNYVLQVYKTTATIDSLKLTGGDAALLVNGSDVTLTGIIDVSGNEFGGIEVSKGSAVGLTNSLLTTTGTLFNSTEKYAQPTLWTVNEQGTVSGSGVPIATNTTIKADQTQYYLDAKHLDIIAPVINLQGVNPQTIELGSGYVELGATTDDNSNVTIDSSKFINVIGSYTITYSSTDTAGNIATPVTRTVDVVDTTAPVITAPANITTEATGVNTVVVLGTPIISDNSGAILTATNNAPVNFPIDTTTVTWTVIDASLNSSTATQTVTITDSTAPVISGTPTDITAEATSKNGAVVTYILPTATDLVSENVEVVCTLASGSTFALGNTTVNCSAKDAKGNESTSSFIVTVQDKTAPVITLDNAVISLFVGDSYTDAGAIVTDIVDGTKTIDGVGTVDTSKVGTYTITYNYTDEAGNKATEITKTVIVNIKTTATNVVLLTENNEISGLPEATIPTSTDLSIAGTGITAFVNIPADTVVTGPTGWDGTINLPSIVKTVVNPIADNGNNISSVNSIEIGLPDVHLTFSNPVKITFAGDANSLVGWSQGGIFHNITNACDLTKNPIIGADSECKIVDGKDLVVWTTHFTTFTAYTQTAKRSSSSGSRAIPATPAVPTVSPAVPAVPAVGKVLGAEAYNFTLLMRNNSKGNEVIELQKYLIANGYLTGIADGSFGPKTLEGVKKFQTANSLVADGIVGPAARAILNKVLVTPATPAIPADGSGAVSVTYNFGTTNLKNGSQGDAVQELQRFLNNTLGLGLVVDGKLGPKTIAVIKQWQGDNGLIADGIIGIKTKALMNSQVK